jgi:hypothetical protein
MIEEVTGTPLVDFDLEGESDTSNKAIMKKLMEADSISCLRLESTIATSVLSRLS